MQVEITNTEAFAELQSKIIETNRILGQVLNKINICKQEKRRNELTINELETIPDTTKTYKAVGKMFLLASKPQIKTEIVNSIKKHDSELQMLANQQKYLENEIGDCEKSIKELIVKRS